MKDMSGLQPSGYIRGARMGDQTIYLGTHQADDPAMFDCCNQGYSLIPDDQLDSQMLWHSKVGFQTLGWWKNYAGWQSRSFCQYSPGEAQPSHGCTETTWMSPDLACTFLQKCNHAKCPDYKGQSCPSGKGESHEYNWEPSWWEDEVSWYKNWMSESVWNKVAVYGGAAFTAIGIGGLMGTA